MSPVVPLADLLNELRAKAYASTRYKGGNHKPHTAHICWRAAEKIEELDSAPRGHVTAWIPVTERLPRDGGDYLAIVNGFCVVCEFFNVTRSWTLEGDTVPQTVTHWMPLPPPPGAE